MSVLARSTATRQAGVVGRCPCGARLAPDAGTVCADCEELGVQLELRRLEIAHRNRNYAHLMPSDFKCEPGANLPAPEDEMPEGETSPLVMALQAALALLAAFELSALGVGLWWGVRQLLAATLRWGWW